MNNQDHISEKLKIIFWVKILKFFDADPAWKKFGSGWKKVGSGINKTTSDQNLRYLYKGLISVYQ
jgi:hypothetical protein